MRRPPRRSDRAHSMRARLMCIAVSAMALLAVPLPAVDFVDLATFPRTSVEIRAATGAHRFDVWLADTPTRQAQGLMFVRELPADAGMLFVTDDLREMSMWMKNTHIPLDMVFIDERGRIVRIAAETTPHSLETVSSGARVKAVLELRGGEAERRGIRVGDSVVHAAFTRKAA